MERTEILSAAEDGAVSAPRPQQSRQLQKKKWTSHSLPALFLALFPMLGFLLFSTAPLVIWVQNIKAGKAAIQIDTSDRRLLR